MRSWTIMVAVRLGAVGLGVMCLGAAPVFGQVRSGGGVVDQGVGDLGPNSASLRKVEPGIGQFSHRVQLSRRASWRVSGAARVDGRTGLDLPQPFVIHIPGVTAYVQRPEYLVRDREGNPAINVAPGRDGRHLSLIPANTVFSLIPPRRMTYGPAVEQGAGGMERGGKGRGAWHDTRISTRLDTRINGRISGRVNGLYSTEFSTRISGNYDPLMLGAKHWPAGTYVVGKGLLGKRRSLKASGPVPSLGGREGGGWTYRAGSAPGSVKGQLQVVEQAHVAKAGGDQGDHAGGQ